MGFMESRQDLTATIKEQTDIVKIIGEYVELKRSGVRYLGLCPFHGEKTPSFSVHGAQQFFHCFGCAESGDVFSFLMKYHSYDFPTALKYLADRLNIALPEKKLSWKEREQQERRDRMYAVLEKATRIYQRYLQDEDAGMIARQYLETRGISSSIQARFQLGYAPPKGRVGWNFLGGKLSVEEQKTAEEVGLLARGTRGGRYDRFRDRVLFPIHDRKGKICGFGGRIIGEGQPKYMNSPESPIFNKSRNLLGLHQQMQEIRKAKKAIIVEGNFDLISLVRHGCPNAVAPLGTALTASQIRLLGKYAEEVILLFDGDAAGTKAAMRAAPLFLGEGVYAKVALLPEGHDPDTYVQQLGVEKLKALLDAADELPEFVVNQLVVEHGLSLEGKSKIAEEIKPLLVAAPSALQRSVVTAHFAAKLGVDPNRLEASTATAEINEPQQSVKQSTRRDEGEVLRPLTSAQRRLVEFMILHLQFFEELERAGIRTILQGGIGEIVFLQIQYMVKENSDLQPEDVLQALPEGAERKLVRDTLLKAAEGSEAEQVEVELREMLEWLSVESMRHRSKEVNVEIERVQQAGDHTALVKLLQEKQDIEREVRRLREQ
jgi:DNA primase